MTIDCTHDKVLRLKDAEDKNAWACEKCLAQFFPIAMKKGYDLLEDAVREVLGSRFLKSSWDLLHIALDDIDDGRGR